MRTTDRATTLLLLLVVTAAGPAHAQGVLFRVGGGALLASDVGVAGLAAVVAVIESTNAKLRLFRVPELLMVAFILSLLALIFYFIIE